METLTKEKILNSLKKELPYVRERYGVEKIAIFGPFAKGSQRERSDVDILVELTKPLGLDFVALAYYFEDKLGKKVDITTFDFLRKSFENPRYKHIAEDIEKSLAYV